MNEEGKPESAEGKVSIESRRIIERRRLGVGPPQRPGNAPTDPIEAYMRTPRRRDPKAMAHGS